MQNWKKALIGLGTLALAAGAQAAVDTEISGMATDATTLFDSVKTIKIAVVGFGIALAFIAMLKSRR